MLLEILLIAVITFKNLQALRGNCSIDAALTYVYDNGVFFFKDNNYGPWNIDTNKLGLFLIKTEWKMNETIEMVNISVMFWYF